MAIKASANITIFRVREVVSTTTYYLLQSSTANPPSIPTTDNPGSNWSTTEPTYTAGSTNTLYTVTKTKYSDVVNPEASQAQQRDFEYTPVSKSTAYEAAKAAYNKAVVVQESLDGMDFDGTNLVSNIVNTDPSKSKWVVGEYVINKDPDDSGAIADTSGKLRYTVAATVNEGDKYQFQIFGRDSAFILITLYGNNPATGKSIYISYVNNLGHQNTEWICPSNVNKVRLTIYSDDPNDGVELDDIDKNIFVKVSKSDKTSEFSYSYEDINEKLNITKEDWNNYFNNNYKDKLDNAYSTSAKNKSDLKDLEDDYKAKIAEYEDAETGKFAKFQTAIDKNKKDIELMASLIGGNNLIRNSVGFNDIEQWNVTHPENINTSQVASLENETISHSSFILEGASELTQTISIEPENYYNISVRIKHKKESTAQSTNKVHVYIQLGSNDKIEVLMKENVDNTETEYIDFEKFQYTDIISNNEETITVYLENEGNDYFEISDLMLAVGTIPLVWSQHKEEIYGKSVILDVDGLKVYPRNNQGVDKSKRSMVTDNGFKTEIIDDGQSLPTVTSYLNKEGMKTDNVYAVENIYIGESEDNHILRMTKILVTETINQQTVQHIDIIEY